MAAVRPYCHRASDGVGRTLLSDAFDVDGVRLDQIQNQVQRRRTGVSDPRSQVVLALLRFQPIISGTSTKRVVFDCHSKRCDIGFCGGKELPSIRGEIRRIERWLATARVFLAISALVAIRMDPGEIRYSFWAYGLLAFYIAQGVVVILLLRRREESTISFRRLVHAADPAGGVHLLGEAEIGQVGLLAAAPLLDDHVARLDIAVDEAARMGLVEGARHLARRSAPRGHRPACPRDGPGSPGRRRPRSASPGRGSRRRRHPPRRSGSRSDARSRRRVATRA